MSLLLRVIMVGLIVWGLWRIYAALYPPSPRHPPRKETQDEWQDVLEAIDELPEAVEPPDRIRDGDRVLLSPLDQRERFETEEGIEAIIVQEAEMALSLIREGDENERLTAYHEITIYEKLCSMADGHVSAATRKKIDDIHQRAWEMMCPPDDDDDD